MTKNYTRKYFQKVETLHSNVSLCIIPFTIIQLYTTV